MTEFPNRPDHPDFWLMSEAILDLDAASEDGIPLQKVIGDVDLKSLTYVAEQRGRRSSKIPEMPDLPPSVRDQVRAAAAWLDGFMAGARFRQMKQERGQ